MRHENITEKPEQGENTQSKIKVVNNWENKQERKFSKTTSTANTYFHQKATIRFFL